MFPLATLLQLVDTFFCIWWWGGGKRLSKRWRPVSSCVVATLHRTFGKGSLVFSYGTLRIWAYYFGDTIWHVTLLSELSAHAGCRAGDDGCGACWSYYGTEVRVLLTIRYRSRESRRHEATRYVAKRRRRSSNYDALANGGCGYGADLLLHYTAFDALRVYGFCCRGA